MRFPKLRISVDIPRDNAVPETVIKGPVSLPARSMREEVDEVGFGVLLKFADGLKCRVKPIAGEESVLLRIRHEASFLRGRPRFPDVRRLDERALLA